MSLSQHADTVHPGLQEPSPVTVLAEGLQFPEGPIWMPDGSIILVEIKRGTLSRVSTDGEVSVIADLGGGPNGAAIGPDGKVYVCNNGGFEWSEQVGLTIPGDRSASYTGGSIQRVDVETGEVEVLYSEVEGHALSGPNDIVFDGTGGFWFTDLGQGDERSRDRGGIYYAAADGSSVREVLYPVLSPNGIGLSPDGSLLYAADTMSGRLNVWGLEGPGQITDYFGPHHRGLVMASPDGGPMFDSLAVDSDGNINVATIGDGGITVVAPDGSHHHVPFEDPLTTNICFGGQDLRTAFVTLSGTGRLVSTPWPTAGLVLAH